MYGPRTELPFPGRPVVDLHPGVKLLGVGPGNGPPLAAADPVIVAAALEPAERQRSLLEREVDEARRQALEDPGQVRLHRRVRTAEEKRRVRVPEQDRVVVRRMADRHVRDEGRILRGRRGLEKQRAHHGVRVRLRADDVARVSPPGTARTGGKSRTRSGWSRTSATETPSRLWRSRQLQQLVAEREVVEDVASFL